MPDTRLLIIDAQNDFIDLPDSYGYKPALPVPGGHQDCLRLARLIRQAGAGISGIIASLDSHHVIDLAHNICWVDEQGNTLPPFTPVTASDLRGGRYRPAANIASRELWAYLSGYLNDLERLGRTLILWPPHCQIGTPGHNLHAELAAALRDWEMLTFKPVGFLQKGENILTESFSALKAVIPYPGDAATELNRHLLGRLSEPDRLLVAGQASSHCVKETVEDILHYGDAGMAAKLTILTDCMSPVPGFETLARRFFSDLQSRGVRLATSVEILPELAGNIKQE